DVSVAVQGRALQIPFVVFRRTIDAIADLELMEMVVEPVEDGLDHVMQAAEREIHRDIDTTPDRRLRIRELVPEPYDPLCRSRHSHVLEGVLLHHIKPASAPRLSPDLRHSPAACTLRSGDRSTHPRPSPDAYALPRPGGH